MSRVRPILFNGEMVRAILDGRKTVTRRVVNPQPKKEMMHKLGFCVDGDKRDIGKFGFGSNESGGRILYAKPHCLPGDILYVRETYYKGKNCVFYKASNPNLTGYRSMDGEDIKIKWRPSIHMPKEAARIWLKVTDVRVERLQEITNEQMLKEGISEETIKHYMAQMPEASEEWIRAAHVIPFSELWDSTIKKPDLDRYDWDANPFVWVIEFERCEKPDGWPG